MPPLLALPAFIAGLTLTQVATILSIAITVGTTVFGTVQQKASEESET